VGANLLASVEAIAGNGSGLLRLLLQTRDALAAVRGQSLGAKLILVNEWSEDMARATFVPRFIEADNEVGWRRVWDVVGGHPAHLRRIADLLVEERQRAARDKKQEEIEKKRVAAMRVREDRSPDAEVFAKIAEEQYDADSFRADATVEIGPLEALLRRLPEAFEDEVVTFEARMTSFLQHPFLQASNGNHAGASGVVDNHVISLRKLCGEHGLIFQSGIKEATDPIVMALLDVGILVPAGGSAGVSRVDIANKFTRSLLLAWTDAQVAALPWQQRLQCRWWLWRNG